LLLIIDTGLRVNECLTLKKNQIDFDNLLLYVVGKGNKERIVPFSYELRKVLFKYSATHSFELLFCTKSGCKVAYDNILRDFYVLIKKLGINPDGAFHSFRRTFATNYVRNGGNPLVLQRMLGHTTLQLTNVYIKLITEDLQKEQHRTSLLNRLR
jgi:integrase/recombinase XerD